MTKPGAIDPSLHVFTGEARVFDSEDDANAAILAGKIQAGNVVVIRTRGRRAARHAGDVPGHEVPLRHGSEQKHRPGDRRPVFGDEQRVLRGAHSPEAAEGGPLAIVRDGDKITVDVIEGTLHLHVSDGEIWERFASWKKPAPKVTRGHLALYSRLASSAAKGAVVRAE